MQPERHIEKLLRAFARTRREKAGAPPVLHPATRRMLLGEVARQHAREYAGATARWAGWRSLWPKFALVTALLVVVGIGAFLVIPPKDDAPTTMTLAKRETTGRAFETPALPPAASAPSPAKPVTTAAVEREQALVPPRAKMVSRAPSSTSGKVSDKQVGLQANALTEREVPQSGVAYDLAQTKRAESPLPPASATLKAVSPNASGVAARPGIAAHELEAAASSVAEGATPERRSREQTAIGRQRSASRSNLPPLASPGGEVARRTLASVPQRASEELLQANPPSALATSAARPVTNVSQVTVQNFARMAPRPGSVAGKATASDAVLASFQFELRGRQIRIVDRDGSVYVGSVGLPDPVSPTPAAEESSVFFAARDNGTTVVARREAGKALDSKAQGLPELLPFSVRGTNATLQQVVVFTGSVQQLPSGQHYGLSNQAARVVGRYENFSPAQNQFQNARVLGRARFSDGRQFEINAVAMPDAGKSGPK
ncbi:MAG TPA: hypothetical protein VI136_04175 [Verrucomicrobiae bacterium]